MEACSKVERVFLKYILYNIHLMNGPGGNSYFYFPSSPDISFDFISRNIRTQGKTKLTSFW